MEKLKEPKPGLAYRLSSFSVLLLLFAVNSFSFRAASEASLRIQLENVRNSKGSIRLALFKGEAGFPADRKKAARVLSVPAKAGKVDVKFQNLPSGRYAVILLHDENENGEMDTNLVGYPKEGYGASNNNLPMFRAPSFDEAAFEVGQKEEFLSIRIRY